METPSNPKTEDYTYKQGQYSPRKRKDTTPKVNPQLAVELVFQELKRVEAYTKRIEDATAKKVENGQRKSRKCRKSPKKCIGGL